MDKATHWSVFWKALCLGLYAWLNSWLFRDWWWLLPIANFWLAVAFGVASAILLVVILCGHGRHVSKHSDWDLLLSVVGYPVAMMMLAGLTYEYWPTIGTIYLWFLAGLCVLVACGLVVGLVVKAVRYATGNPEYRPKEARTPRE